MSITLQTYPASLADVKAEKFYLELVGESQPLVSPRATEVGGGQSLSLYEYYWSLGHLEGLPTKDCEAAQVGELKVYFLFAEMSDWRINEPIASVKYMSPAPSDVQDVIKRISKDLKNATAVTSLIPGGGTASKWIDAAAGIGMSSIPQEGHFKWSVRQTAIQISGEIATGVVWTIPKSMFDALHGRITGGLVVSFLPAYTHTDNVENNRKRGKILLRAELAGRPRRPFPKLPWEKYNPINVPDGEDPYLTLPLELKFPADDDNRPAPGESPPMPPG
jgi:hypothetical protein